MLAFEEKLNHQAKYWTLTNERIGHRKNILLMGDILADVNMVDKIDYDNLLSIGFLNSPKNLEEDVKNYRVYSWQYALPVCSPEFHRNLNEIKRMSVENVQLCGDYMSLPSLDGAIKSGKSAAVNLMQER